MSEKGNKLRKVAGAFLMLLLCINLFSFEAFAASVGKALYEDIMSGDLTYKDFALPDSEVFGYELVGFTIHRPDAYGHESGEQYVTVKFEEEYEETEAGTQVSIKKVGKSLIGAMINAYDGGWYEDWTSGKAGKVWCNGIVRTYVIDQDGQKVYSGELRDDGTYVGQLYDFGTRTVSVADPDKGYESAEAGNIGDLEGAYSWSGKLEADIPSLFHMQYVYNPDAEEKVEENQDIASSELLRYDTHQMPEIFTWHESREGDEIKYNVGEGIPAGKEITNGFLADAFYGAWAIEKLPVIEKTYTVDFSITGHELKTREIRLGDGSVQTESYWDPWTVSLTEQVYRSASYYALRSIEMSILRKVTVHNKAYDVVDYKADIEDLGGINALINGEEPSTYMNVYPTDREKHITWPEQPAPISVAIPGDVPKPTVDQARTLAGTAERAEAAVGLVKSFNDTLVVNGVTLLDGTEVEATRTNEYLIEPADPDDDLMTYVSDSKDITIPVYKDNGRYDTTIDAEYVRVIPADNNLRTVEAKGKSAIIPEMMVQFVDPAEQPVSYEYFSDVAGYSMDQNEPVVIHVPVVANVELKTGGSTPEPITEEMPTQMVRPADPDDLWDADLRAQGIKTYNLLLDGTYTIGFEPYEWLSEEVSEMTNPEKTNDKVKTDTSPGGKTGHKLSEYEESDFEEFIKKREVRFPFDVKLLSSDQKIYTASGTDPSGIEWTPWIEIYDNSVQFYVPTTVEESAKKFGMNNRDKYYNIEFRITATNANEDEEDDEEDIANTELGNHVATFSVPVNVSGYLYDFTVVGVNDRDMFYGYDKQNKTNAAPFAVNKDEFPAGKKDRTGADGRRSALDGLYRSLDDNDILPLKEGSSKVYPSMGALWKGSTFYFMVKTMGRAFTGDNDEVVIRPTLRYYDRDGNLVDNVKFYYTVSTQAGKEEKYVEFGSEKDKDIVFTTRLADSAFRGAWYQGDAFLTEDKDIPEGYTLPDTVKFTVPETDQTRFLNAENNTSYGLSEIVLKKSQRLFTGSADELTQNTGKTRVDAEYTGTDKETTAPVNTPFKESVQTWYGQYTIPQRFFVAVPEGATEEERNKFIENKAKSGELSENADFWLKDGYLVVNFGNIKAYQGGEEPDEASSYKLTYGGGTLDMWKQQGYPEQAMVREQVDPDAVYAEKTIDLQEGDVAIYDLRYSLSDKYEGRINAIGNR